MSKRRSHPFRQLITISFSKKLLLFFGFSFLLGILLFHLIGRRYLNDFIFFSDIALSHFKEISLPFTSLFPYLLKLRMSMLLVLLFLGCTRLKHFFYALFAGWFGFSYGFLSSFCCFKFSLVGSLLFFGMLLPHVPFYFFSFALLSCWFHEKKKSIASHSIGILFLLPAVLSFFFVLVGCLLESTASPLLLKKLLELLSI